MARRAVHPGPVAVPPPVAPADDAGTATRTGRDDRARDDSQDETTEHSATVALEGGSVRSDDAALSSSVEPHGAVGYYAPTR